MREVIEGVLLTTKWQYNHLRIHAIGRNQAKLPDFCYQNQWKTLATKCRHYGKKTSMKMIRYYAHSTGSLTMQLYIQLKDKAIEARTLKLLIFRPARWSQWIHPTNRCTNLKQHGVLVTYELTLVDLIELWMVEKAGL